MKDVSCRILEMFFSELKKKRLPTSMLTYGVGYSEAHIRNKHERIEWSAFVRLMENAQKIWTDDEIVAMGGAWIDSPFLKHTRAIAGALFTPKQFYRWLATNEAKGLSETKAGGAEMFSCVETTYLDGGPNRLSLEVRLHEGREPCPAFFLLNLGGFRDIPRLAGKPRALVQTTPIERGMRYDITLPPGSDRVNRFHRVIRWIASPVAVADELQDAHVSLQTRYEELDSARARLAIQAAQLRTAHTVNGLIQQNLDLDLTIEAIANALVHEAGFERARVELDTEVDGISIHRSLERSTSNSDTSRSDAAQSRRLERLLERRGGLRTGTLTVYATSPSNLDERDALLSFIVPSISMAIDNAISYLVVEELRRGLEVRVAERTAELSQARDDLAGTVRDLEEAKEVRDRIFANINHDLRSPLALVLLSVNEARSAQNGSTSIATSHTLDAIEHGARRVLRMVDELLILAEGRERNVRLWTALCDLGEMVEAVADAWKPAARAAKLTLAHDIQKGILVRADPNAIERVLANLVSNAVKFTPEGGHIDVHVSSEDGHAVIEVRDDGPGIASDMQGRLFGRFERGSTAKGSAIGGSGLGLSLVKELVEAHGGDVVVRQTNNRGTTFRVRLPIATPSATTNGTNEPIAATTPLLRPSDYGADRDTSELPTVYDPPKTPRAVILLAEDDPDLRDRTAKVLATEYRVFTAADGLKAYELAILHSPDLLVTDIAMPGIDGIELTKRFRALETNRMAPVLVLTTFGGIGDRLAGFEAGAVDYIHKPFEPAELRARVKSQLALRGLALQLLETEKLAALGTLSAGLAHEIRNPANGVINAVGPLRELLPSEAIAPDKPAGQLLDIIEDCSKQVASLSRELLGFKRNAQLTRQPVAIETLLRRAKNTVRHMFEGVELREKLDYRGSIQCAEPLLAQVLVNLLENAAYAAKRGGWVELRTEMEAERIVIELVDSGPGVPEELRERIFEPFFTTKPAGRGTGLGLSTARDIVLRHGGSLDVRHAAGHTIFHLEIPQPS